MLENTREIADNATVAGRLCHGSPWISGPLVGPSCPTAHTAACGTLAGSTAVIGDTGSGPSAQGHDGLPDANSLQPVSFFENGRRTLEIHHGQNQALISDFIRGQVAFCPRAKSTEIPETKPPHARSWRALRERCDKHAAGNCAYPFCRCIKTTRDQWERSDKYDAAKVRGEAA